jgi:CBS domain-containing protein
MAIDPDSPASEGTDEAYYDPDRRQSGRFDARLLRQPLSVLPARRPLICSSKQTVSTAMRAMQSEHRGIVLVTEDGTPQSRLTGVFTERDVLLRIIDRGRNPASLPLAEVMTIDPEVLPAQATVAWVLNKMSVGGFRHVPVVDDRHRPVSVVSVRDVVQFLVDAFPREVLNLPPEFGASDFFPTREGA